MCRFLIASGLLLLPQPLDKTLELSFLHDLRLLDPSFTFVFTFTLTAASAAPLAPAGHCRVSDQLEEVYAA